MYTYIYIYIYIYISIYIYATARRTDDAAEGENIGQEDTEDCQINVFLGCCWGLSRNALEKGIARQT